MSKFMDKDFLLTTKEAQKLFHEGLKDVPIFDYHCHLSPQEIYENKQPADIAELWLKGDHYKWRAMRSCGVNEAYITGSESNYEKFKKWAYTLKYCIGNPLYHWAHLELQRYFDINTPLSAETADDIWERVNKKIADSDFRPQTLIMQSNVKALCTTDDPVDSLEYHQLLAQKEDFSVKVLPTFRPDKALNINLPGFKEYIEKLGEVSGVAISSVKDVLTALGNRADFFHSVGGRISDQSFDYVPFVEATDAELEKIFAAAMNGQTLSQIQVDQYRTAVFGFLARKYHQLGWSMEIHIGAMRNNNEKMFNQLGPDVGFDSIGDHNIALSLSKFLNSVNVTGELPKTLLFNLHQKDNYVLGTMLGNFQSDEAESKLQFGPAWWFLDNIDGMTEHLKTLGNLGVLGKFVGMETDSRSFLSYPRHEYFRRILCGVIGEWISKGLYPDDTNALFEIVQGIAYYNAVSYFNV